MSLTRTLAQFARDCGGVLRGEDRPFTGVSIDTRTLRGGELFVALRGPRFDGAQFLAAALERGAAGVVLECEQPLAAAQIVVSDTLQALQRAAQARRAALSIPVIGVAGSNG
ncbi:MAG: Mur ligase domain-containing protein, partial [Steroidobacteraceae bacterium]